MQGQELERSVAETDDRVAFRIRLETGPARLQGFLTDKQGQTRGAYYVRIEASDEGQGK
jgi:hypothetical protein